jgi:hypothetical protein
MTTILPKLCRLDIQSQSKWYHLPMVFTTDESESSLPQIVFVAQDATDYIQKPSQFELTGGEMVKLAFSNLEQISVPLNEIQQGVFGAENVTNAAEKILDKAYIRAAAARLGTDQLLVSIPVENAIFIGDINDEESKKSILSLASDKYIDISKKPLTHYCFAMDDGVIVESIAAKIKGFSELRKENLPEGFEANEMVMKMMNDMYFVTMMITSSNISTIIDGILKTINNELCDHLTARTFVGLIEIQTTQASIALDDQITKEIAKTLQSLTQNLKLQDLSTKYKKEIQITFLTGDQFQRGLQHQKLKFTIKPKLL